MGIIRCDHYLPADECFKTQKRKFNITLHSELWQVQKKDGEYRYAYDIHKPKRILKNLSVRVDQTHQEPDYVVVFDYLSSNMKVIDKIVYFMELAHYFIANCSMRPATWYFVEGTPGFDHLMKSLLKKKEMSIRTEKLEDKFLRNRHVIFQPGEVGKNKSKTYLISIQNSQTIFNEIIKENRSQRYKKLFCDQMTLP